MQKCVILIPFYMKKKGWMVARLRLFAMFSVRNYSSIQKRKLVMYLRNGEHFNKYYYKNIKITRHSLKKNNNIILLIYYVA